MSLYKIMIVDDEAEARQGIARRISWGALGFQVVAEAENGVDALEKAELYKPDVVLTDIKMPFMDGMELVRRLSRLYPAMRLLIFTGFDEFEYAKEAIGLGVEEYILKPVNEEELSELVTRLKNKLDVELERKKDMELLRETYAKALPILRERFLQELVWGTLSGEEARREIDRFGIPFTSAQIKNVAVFDIDLKKAEAAVSRELVPISLRQLIDSQFSGRCFHESFIGSHEVVVISAWDAQNPISDIMGLVSEICAECRSILELPVTAGVSRCRTDLSALHTSYAEACSAVEYKAIVGSGAAIYIQDMEKELSEPPGFTPDIEKRMLSAIKFGGPEQIAAMVDAILAPAAGVDRTTWRYQAAIIGILSSIARIMTRYEIDDAAVLGDGRDMLFSVGSGYSEEELRQWLTGVCIKMNDFLADRRVSTEKRIVAQAERHIIENCSDSTLSVDSMCEQLHLSRSYFSTLFKRGTGKSFVSYLTDVRMQKAVELLEQTDDKTYIIAKKVGYEEPNYFSYVFKKHFGVSPTGYRSRSR